VLLRQEPRTSRKAAERFCRVTSRLHGLLPRFLKWIPETAIGFAMIGLTGFFIDIGMLTLLHGAFTVSYPLAVTLSYGTASVANFFLNRWLNFQMHGNIAKQSGRQAVVAISNYVIWILGVSTVLELIGVQYQVARIVSACVEGIYLYVMMRVWVFPAREQRELVSRDTQPALEPATDDSLTP
jgi:putative flippase GtrA